MHTVLSAAEQLRFNTLFPRNGFVCIIALTVSFCVELCSLLKIFFVISVDD